MSQFDVYQNPNPTSKKKFPYLIDVQADLLNHLSTRVVIPFMLSSKIKHPIKHLMPHFSIEETSVTLITSEITSVSTRILNKKIASLRYKRNEIIAAIDFLFTGI